MKKNTAIPRSIPAVSTPMSQNMMFSQDQDTSDHNVSSIFASQNAGGLMGDFLRLMTNDPISSANEAQDDEDGGVLSGSIRPGVREDESKEKDSDDGFKEDSDDGGSKEASDDDGSKEASDDDGSKEASDDDGSKEASDDDGSKEASDGEAEDVSDDEKGSANDIVQTQAMHPRTGGKGPMKRMKMLYQQHEARKHFFEDSDDDENMAESGMANGDEDGSGVSGNGDENTFGADDDDDASGMADDDDDVSGVSGSGQPGTAVDALENTTGSTTDAPNDDQNPAKKMRKEPPKSLMVQSQNKALKKIAKNDGVTIKVSLEELRRLHRESGINTKNNTHDAHNERTELCKAIFHCDPVRVGSTYGVFVAGATGTRRAAVVLDSTAQTSTEAIKSTTIVEIPSDGDGHATILECMTLIAHGFSRPLWHNKSYKSVSDALKKKAQKKTLDPVEKAALERVIATGDQNPDLRMQSITGYRGRVFLFALADKDYRAKYQAQILAAVADLDGFATKRRKTVKKSRKTSARTLLNNMKKIRPDLFLEEAEPQQAGDKRKAENDNEASAATGAE